MLLFSCRYKYFSGINDRFFSTFLFEFNIGFAFGSHLALFALGSIGKDEVLTGVFFKNEERNPSLFYPLFFGTILTIGSISSLTTAAQKWKGWAKEKKRARKINIMINQEQYGNMGCGVFKQGIQNYKDFCLIINITKRK